MSAKDKVVRFLYRFFYWLVPWWYGLTMTLTRKRRYPRVAIYSNAKGINWAIKWGRRWRADPVNGLVDVMMSPVKFQHHIDKEHEAFGDCDDHAIYWATALLKSGLAKKAYLGTVWYSRTDGSRGSGHVVCVYQDMLDDKWYWVDYKDPRAASISNWEWATSVAFSRNKLVRAAGLFEVSLRKSGQPKLHKKVKRWIP